MTLARSPVMPKITSTSAGCPPTSELVAIATSVDRGDRSVWTSVWAGRSGNGTPTEGEAGSFARQLGRTMAALLETFPAFVALTVNPVPWARAQMAFTLAVHIILVPLGVSWAFMTLIANYRGIRHADRAALVLAQRWSKYMAVTFAVGAVTGTVLSFEFGLLWPRFMGQWGEAFGVPFAFEGLFFFAEAILLTIYLFAWRRLRPWTHFWTGVRYHRLGFIIAFSVAAVATPIQMGVGDALARWVYNEQPVKFAAIEFVPTT